MLTSLPILRKYTYSMPERDFWELQVGGKSGSASNSYQAVVTVKVAIDALFVIAVLTSALLCYLPSAVF